MAGVYTCNFYPGVMVRMNPGAMQPATDTCGVSGGEHRVALGIRRGTDGIEYVTWAAGGYSPLRHPTAIGEDLFTLIPDAGEQFFSVPGPGRKRADGTRSIPSAAVVGDNTGNALTGGPLLAASVTSHSDVAHTEHAPYKLLVKLPGMYLCLFYPGVVLRVSPAPLDPDAKVSHGR